MLCLPTKSYFAVWTNVGKPMDIVWTETNYSPQYRHLHNQWHELQAILICCFMFWFAYAEKFA